LIKAGIPDQLLADFFTKYFLPPITHDVAMGGIITEYQDIACAQYLDLVYSQSDTLYDLIPNPPIPSTNPTSVSTTASHAVDGVVGFVTQETKGKPSNPSKFIPSTTQVTTTTTSPICPEKTFEINTVQNTTSGKDQSSESKKKGKGKATQNAQQKEKPKTPPADET
jgi:hypothetical protein